MRTNFLFILFGFFDLESVEMCFYFYIDMIKMEKKEGWKVVKNIMENEEKRVNRLYIVFLKVVVVEI